MPKQTLSVTNEKLLAEMRTLDADLLITEKQAALILGESSETLRWKRREQDKKVQAAAMGKPVAEIDLLPVDQSMARGRVRYALGDVRRVRNNRTHVGRAARDAAQKRREEGWMGFGSWLANASMDDAWIFTIVDGVPIDFTTSLVMADQKDWEEDSEQIEQLTLADYLSMRLQAANLASATREADTLARGMPDPAGEGVVCLRCGKPHSGPCRF